MANTQIGLMLSNTAFVPATAVTAEAAHDGMSALQYRLALADAVANRMPARDEAVGHPLFSRRIDLHMTVPLELLFEAERGRSAAPLQEGALMLACDMPPIMMPAKFDDGERQAVMGWLGNLFKSPLRELRREAEAHIRSMSGVDYFVQEDFQRKFLALRREEQIEFALEIAKRVSLIVSALDIAMKVSPIMSALEAILALLDVEDRLFLALKLEERLRSRSWDIRNAAVLALGILVPHIDAQHRLEHILKIEEMLEDESPYIRTSAIHAMVAAIPHIAAGDRLDRAFAIFRRLGDEHWNTRCAASRGLGAVSPHLEGDDQLKLVLAVERLRRDRNMEVVESAIRALGEISPHLRENVRQMEKALRDLRHPAVMVEERWRALLVFAYAHGNTLSPGAIRLLILLGRKMLRGEVGSLEYLEAPAKGERYALQDVATRLKELARSFRDAEAVLGGYPTIGGKIRRLQQRMIEAGYRSRLEDLVTGEGGPILLEPARYPMIIVQTIEELVYLAWRSDPLSFSVSATFSGKVGDDLRSAALGVHSLLRTPYPFPDTIKSDALITWFAPVVEGGWVFLDLDGERGRYGGKRVLENEKRYDHLFLHFERPPKLEHFRRAGSDDRWVKARDEFAATLVPVVERLDRHGRSVVVHMEGSDMHFLWFPPASEWRAMTRKMPGGETRVEKDVFETLLFLEFARRSLRKELQEAIETAWVLGMLCEVRRDGRGALDIPAGIAASGGNILKVLARPALMDLAVHYESGMARLFADAGLARVLETPWVKNKDWPAIRDDMRAFQRALAEDANFRCAVQKLVRETVSNAKEILWPPLI